MLVPLQLLMNVGEIGEVLAPGLETQASSGNNLSSRSDSDISAGSGQLNPAARKRSTYSCTVLALIEAGVSGPS